MIPTINEFCPVCRERWQFIHEHGDEWFLAHYCDVAKAYVFWNRRYTFYTHMEKSGEG